LKLCRRPAVISSAVAHRGLGKRTGLAPSTISNWCTAGKWTRPVFAPRATDTVPRWRARIRLRRRTLAGRLYDLAERWVRELDAQPGVDNEMSEFSFDEIRYLAAKARLPEKLVIDTAWETVTHFRDQWTAAKKGLAYRCHGLWGRRNAHEEFGFVIEDLKALSFTECLM